MLGDEGVKRDVARLVMKMNEVMIDEGMIPQAELFPRDENRRKHIQELFVKDMGLSEKDAARKREMYVLRLCH
jgi:hypothetical protein